MNCVLEPDLRRGRYTICSLSWAFALLVLTGASQAEDSIAPAIPRAAQAAEPIAAAISQFAADVETLDRRYRVPLDSAAVQVHTKLLQEWTERLATRDFESLSRVDQIDYLLLARELEYRLAKIHIDQRRDEQARKWLPYADDLISFLKVREEVESIDPATVASQLDRAAAVVEDLVQQTEARVLDGSLSKRVLSTHDLAEGVGADPPSSSAESTPDKAEQEIVPGADSPADNTADATSTAQAAGTEATVKRRLSGLRASEIIADFVDSLKEADRFYSGYDPSYSWWVSQPMERLREAMEKHRVALREQIVGVPDSDQETIIGQPIGLEGLALELQHEWIAHEPAELISLAEREMDWCDQQIKAAAAELGCGDDWRKALDLVKAKHVPPGEQPRLIRELAWEAIHFLEAHDLVTVPPLAASGWTMSMMSPERQRVSPYFLGGDTIIVSYPTDAMTHEEKLMSMRSNNEHFARATVHHELIPGHHLQYYMLPRYRPYRELFATPFWMEGWALYWEMQLWDLDFARNAEDRVGMLFWRRHRCARIIFSLNYHLGTMTPEECVSYLVERVGHERSAAAAEVRRSIMGGYSPLYQAAYMLGGLQLRRLHAEMVQSGQMTNRDFHDAVLHEHSIPIELLRNYMSGVKLTRETHAAWRFAEP